MANVLVLYTRFSAYINAAYNYFAQEHQSNVHVIRFKVDKNSPFQLKTNQYVNLYDREEFDLNKMKEFVRENNISVIVCSGWVDKEYLKLCKWAKNKGLLTICAFDNQWMGTLKQRILTSVSSIVLKDKFCKVWVPGIYQYEYARRLGFERFDIMTRFYTADTNLFKKREKVIVPKKFIYVGRLLEIKGVQLLKSAVEKIIPQLEKNGWEFLIVGSGESSNYFADLSQRSSAIKYHQFLQPEELANLTKDGGVFILPSNYDAWAVVVHEYCLIGCPLLMSEAVGSRNAFLVDEYNGKVFATGSETDFINKLNDFMNTPEDQLIKMGERSQGLSDGYNLEIWSATLHSSIKEFKAGVVHKSLKRTKYQ